MFAKCSDQLASQLSLSLTSGKKDAKQTLLRIGINGDLYGGMRAPLEVGTRRVDIAYVNPAALVAMLTVCKACPAAAGAAKMTRKNTTAGAKELSIIDFIPP